MRAALNFCTKFLVLALLPVSAFAEIQINYIPFGVEPHTFITIDMIAKRSEGCEIRISPEAVEAKTLQALFQKTNDRERQFIYQNIRAKITGIGDSDIFIDKYGNLLSMRKYVVSNLGEESFKLLARLLDELVISHGSGSNCEFFETLILG